MQTLSSKIYRNQNLETSEFSLQVLKMVSLTTAPNLVWCFSATVCATQTVVVLLYLHSRKMALVQLVLNK